MKWMGCGLVFFGSDGKYIEGRGLLPHWHSTGLGWCQSPSAIPHLLWTLRPPLQCVRLDILQRHPSSWQTSECCWMGWPLAGTENLTCKGLHVDRVTLCPWTKASFLRCWSILPNAKENSVATARRTFPILKHSIGSTNHSRAIKRALITDTHAILGSSMYVLKLTFGEAQKVIF